MVVSDDKVSTQKVPSTAQSRCVSQKSLLLLEFWSSIAGVAFGNDEFAKSKHATAYGVHLLTKFIENSKAANSPQDFIKILAKLQQPHPF